MTATLRLYELGAELDEVAEELISNGGELTPALAEQLAALEGAFDEKLARICLYIRNLEAQADVATKEAVRLGVLAKTRERAAERLKTYVLEEMEHAGRPKVETPLVKARIQQNGRPSIQWCGPADLIPDPFKKVTVAVDGTKAYEAWKASGALPDGFLVERGQHLRIS